MRISFPFSHRFSALQRLPLVFKISLLLGLLLSTSLLLTSALFDREMQAYRHQQQQQMAALLGRQTAEVAAGQILAQDWVSLTVSADQLSQLALVSGVEIVDARQQPLAQSGNHGSAVLSTPIELNGSRLGEVRIHLNPQSLTELSLAFYRTTLAAIISSLACWLLLLAYLRRLQVPLQQLLDASDALRREQPMATIACRRRDELGRIAANLNLRFAPPPEPAAQANPPQPVEPMTAAPAPDSQPCATTEGVPGTNAEAPLAAQPAATPPNIRYLLFVDHLSTASHNLTGEERQRLLEPYRRSLEQVSGLYRGEFALDEEGNWWVGFAPLDGEQSHGINALCAASLFNALYRGVNRRAIGRMSPVANIKMALMSGAESFDALRQEAEVLCRSVEANELIVDDALFAIAPLQQRLLGQSRWRKLPQPARLLSSLAADYQSLIDQQAEHFLAQSEHLQQP